MRTIAAQRATIVAMSRYSPSSKGCESGPIVACRETR